MGTEDGRGRTSWRRVACACTAVVAVALPLGTIPAAARPAAPARAARPAKAAKAEWTMLVYLDADNNLEASSLIDLQEMAKAAGPNVNFLVLIDRNAKDQGSPPEVPDGDVLGIPNFSDAKLLALNSGTAKVVRDLGEIDMMDPQNLAWFIWYGLTHYPAKHTGLGFWDHGGAALLPFGEDAESSPEDFLSLPELQQAIGSALEKAGAKKLDFVGFDACLDATIEVARAMRPYAKTMVGSEEVEAGHGWDWTSLRVMQHKGTSGRDVAKALVGSYTAHAASPPFGGESDYTLTALDLNRLGRVDQALKGFVAAMARDPQNGLALLQARQGAIEFGVVGSDPSANFHQIDMVDLLARLPDTLPAEVLTSRNALSAAVKKAVITNVAGPAHAGAGGLAIFLPASGADYTKLYDDHADPTGWRDLLKSILEGASTPEGTDAPAAAGDLDLATQADGWQATMHLADGAGATPLAGATGIFGSPSDDGSSLAPRPAPATVGAGGADDVQASWGYQFVRIDGSPVTAQVEPLQDGFRASVGGVYIDADGTQSEATLQMDLQIADGQLSIGNVALYGSSSGGVGQIYPSDGSRFAPSRLRVSGSEVVATDYNDPADPQSFQVAVDELPSGARFTASLLAFLPDGSTAVRSAVDTRP
ncbi:MAG: clostripain-related cysteine peptidase [Acidimicrobiales bacterium]